MGARQRHYLSQAGKRDGGERGIGLHAKQQLDRLGRGMMGEQETNYNQQEKLLLESNYEVKNLIKELEQRQDEAKAQ